MLRTQSIPTGWILVIGLLLIGILVSITVVMLYLNTYRKFQPQIYLRYSSVLNYRQFCPALCVLIMCENVYA